MLVQVRDKVAMGVMTAARTLFDWATGYGHNMNESKYLTRIIFLESVAGVPGMVGAMVRHLNSLRNMTRDRGRIHLLLEEAENERSHLMWAVQLNQPGIVTRTMILLAQGIAVNAYFFAYLFSPRGCHRFVGYLEEEAVKTYTGAIDALDNGDLPEWCTLVRGDGREDYVACC